MGESQDARYNCFHRNKRSVLLELYYDTTVEPFENPAFNSGKILGLLAKAKSAGFRIKIIDTAGWSREMLMEQYRSLKVPRRQRNDVFGPPRKRGWFFGREVPALVVYFELGEKVDIYPRHVNGSIITVEEFLNQLLGTEVTKK